MPFRILAIRTGENRITTAAAFGVEDLRFETFQEAEQVMLNLQAGRDPFEEIFGNAPALPTPPPDPEETSAMEALRETGFGQVIPLPIPPILRAPAMIGMNPVEIAQDPQIPVGRRRPLCCIGGKNYAF